MIGTKAKDAIVVYSVGTFLDAKVMAKKFGISPHALGMIKNMRKANECCFEVAPRILPLLTNWSKGVKGSRTGAIAAMFIPPKKPKGDKSSKPTKVAEAA